MHCTTRNPYTPFLLLPMLWSAPACAAEPRDGATLYANECASCHDGSAARMPSRASLEAMPTAAIIRALETGVMRVVGNFKLNGPERVAVAEYITGRLFNPNWNASDEKRCTPAQWPAADPFAAPH